MHCGGIEGEEAELILSVAGLPTSTRGEIMEGQLNGKK